MDDKTIEKNNQRMVLIVDDIPKNIQLLGSILKEHNYRIAMATNGKQALEIARSTLPDIILLDIMMPGMDGFEVCRQLKSSEKTGHIPIIFITGRTDVEDIVTGFELGGVDYVTKPFNKVELLARIKTHLDLKEAQDKIIQLEKKNAVFAMSVTANHEINQPLTVLQGNLDMFKSSLDPDDLTERQQKSLSKMESSVEKIRGILEKFRDSTSIHFEEYLDDREMVVFE